MVLEFKHYAAYKLVFNIVLTISAYTDRMPLTPAESMVPKKQKGTNKSLKLDKEVQDG
jgi:hypothetical protein